MASVMCSKQFCRTGPFGSTPVRPVRVAAPTSRTSIVSNSYRTLENVDLSKVPQYAIHENDTGSASYQVARLSARVDQITSHLRENRKDFAARRGLEAVLSQRKRLLQYLFKKDRNQYDNLLAAFNIKSVVLNDTRGAARQKDDKPN